MRYFYDSLESFGLGLGELRENFALKLNVVFLEAGDKFVVGHIAQSCSGADLNLP